MMREFVVDLDIVSYKLNGKCFLVEFFVPEFPYAVFFFKKKISTNMFSERLSIFF